VTFDAKHPGAAERLLADLVPGESGVIAGIAGDPASARRLMELGLVPGTPVEVVRLAPLGDPVELRVRQVHLSLRRSEARRIRVTPA
jgi:Fe2+ transport system protein FeoA